ncbi:polysaccharide deacetylase family protein [Bacillus suaedaesalsae]|uniref:polysaccharide deacetylase family protein n=1 Tax=Bacillus suaedaesalsae TaxID=2810349 RepID=UPI003211B9C2
MNEGHTPRRGVVLTFDDGPGKYTKDILDILQEKQVKAVFFWQSRLVYPKRPWKRLLEEGHILGSHAHNHSNLTRLTKEEQFHHINSSKSILEKLTGIEVKYFRPPFGRYNEETMNIIEKLKMTPVMWDISTYDWELKSEPQRITSNIVDHVEEGSIILLHEVEQTVKALPSIIKGILEKGLSFELLED